MPTFSKILVPTDFSENAQQALIAAASLADDAGSRLTVLYACPNSALREAVREGLLEENDDDATVHRKVRAEVDRRFDAFLEPLGVRSGLVDRHVVFGDPAREIVEFARASGADVIVMGRRGKTLADVLLGSVAERVIRHAPCPVMIVKRPSD